MKSLVALGVVSLLGLSLILFGCSGGSTPSPIALAYVGHSQSHSLTVVNIPANKTVSRIEIGNSSSGSLTQVASYPQRVAVTPDGSRVFVSDGSTSVWVVDTSSNSVAGKIEAGSEPYAMITSPDGRSAYTTSITCGDLLCSGPSKPPQMASLEVIDTASFSLKATLTFGKTPDVFLSGIAISPDGSRVYVTEGTGGNVWVVDTATNSIAATIALANSGLGNASVSPDGKTLYVVAWTKGTIGNSYYLEVIDTHTNTATGHIDLGDFGLPTEIAQTPDGAHLYFTGLVGDLMVIDTANNAVADRVTISKGNPLLGVAITPDGTRAYVSCGNNDTIYVVDTATNRVLESIRSDYPGGLAIAQAR